ncbi:hypothetical protein ACFIJ5_07185 [Haloimpatiens sp. FM7330]|uniref:hypothetical protein n=1 Tax=Haloimpatiens sp. FM7330 TaxID=3298610 RepID=UPI0036262983
MLKSCRQQNKLSYLIGVIFITIIFSTVITNISCAIEKNKTRKYSSTNINDMILINENKVYNEKDMKRKMVQFYLDNKGKYIKWKIKANEFSIFFNTVKYDLKYDVKFSDDSSLYIKCDFDEDVKDKLNKNQTFVVSGQITGYSEFSKSLILKHCKVVGR